MGDLLLQWFSCCHHQSQSTSRRRPPHRHNLKIDRTMIGLPTNFVHTGHIGSADVELSTSHLHEIQRQMESKGGYGRVQVSDWTATKVQSVLILFSFSSRLIEIARGNSAGEGELL